MKGPCVLALHPCFDLVNGVVVDDLHGIFLGITLTMLKLWFNKGSRRKTYYIGDKVGKFSWSCFDFPSSL